MSKFLIRGGAFVFTIILVTLLVNYIGKLNMKNFEGEKVQKIQQNENKQTQIIFDKTDYDFGILKQSGGIVRHDFPFTYIGEGPLTITATPGSCACTTGHVDKKVLQPGEHGILTVEFNPNLHEEPEGRFYKSVLLVTEPQMKELPEVKIWQEIDLDLGPEHFELGPGAHDDDEDHESL